MNQMNEMTKEELQQRTKEIVDFLTEKNEEANPFTPLPWAPVCSPSVRESSIVPSMGPYP